MGLFSKKDKVPELPKAPTLPPLPNVSTTGSREHMLPSISSTKGSDISNEMVKSAVDDYEEPISQPPLRPYAEIPRTSDSEDHRKEVFVKLDKFKQAQKTFEEIKDKLGEIESLTNKAKQLNEKEKAELTKWNEDLNNIKTNVNEIDSEIFNQA